MIEKMSESAGKSVGFRMVGTISQADYAVMVPAVEAIVAAEGAANLLLDMTAFKWEKVSAWDDDFRFGRAYHDKIDKMAIVGDKRWHKWMAKLADQFYANEAAYFSEEESEQAWACMSA